MANSFLAVYRQSVFINYSNIPTKCRNCWPKNRKEFLIFLSKILNWYKNLPKWNPDRPCLYQIISVYVSLLQSRWRYEQRNVLLVHLCVQLFKACLEKSPLCTSMNKLGHLTNAKNLNIKTHFLYAYSSYWNAVNPHMKKTNISINYLLLLDIGKNEICSRHENIQFDMSIRGAQIKLFQSEICS